MDDDDRSQGTPLWSIRSTQSILSIGSKGSILSIGSALSAVSRWSLMSMRSVRGSMDAGNEPALPEAAQADD